MPYRLIAIFIPAIILSGFCCFAQLTTPYYEGRIRYQNKEWKIGVEFFKNKEGKPAAYTHFIEIDGYNRLFAVTYKHPSIHLERQQPGSRPPLIFDGKITADSITGDWEGIGIKGATFILKPATKIKYTEQEIKFQHDSIHLSGTLLVPVSKEKMPLVIFMHGGAPEDRNVYYGSALHFLQKGIAAFIYDKRGVGESKGGDWRTAGITGLAEDALTIAGLLKQRKDIDTNLVGVFGHSEGGWTAPMTTLLSNDIKFVIASGASAVNATEQSVHHRANIMRHDGFNEEAINKATAIRKRINDATKLCTTNTAKALKGLRESIAEIETVKNEPWFASAALPVELSPGCPSAAVMELLFKDPVTIWEKVKTPVYLAWGSDDIVVPVDKRHIILNTLKEKGNKNLTVKFHEGVDHFIMQTNKTGEWDFPRQAKGYFSDMADWINSLKKNKA